MLKAVKGKYRFKFWYLRDKSKKMQVFFQGKDHIVDKVQSWVPCESKYQQYPQCLMQGWAADLHVHIIDKKKTAILV